MPKISVVMPVYNGEKYLKEAIESILNQTFTDFEFVIINDCSSDRTEEIIQSYTDERIIYVKNDKNMGVAATLNRGLDMAKGEYIARMDADDISLPERFEKQVKFLDLHKEYGLCGTDILKFVDGSDYCVQGFSYKNEQIKIDLIFGCALAHPTVMIRKDISDQIDLKYDKTYEKAEDFELWTRISDKIKIAVLNEPLLKYRMHNMQVSVSYNIQQKDACRKIRYTTLVKVLGINGAKKYINVFDKYCNKEKMTSNESNVLCECLCNVLEENKKKRLYNQKLLCEQLFYIKHSITKEHKLKVPIKSWYEYVLLVKVKASELKRRRR